MTNQLAVAVLLALATGQTLSAHDRWEHVLSGRTDDNSSTLNYLQEGAVQVQHDLESTANLDQDWFAFKASARHSYEARVNSGIMYWSTTCTIAACPRFDRVGSVGEILTPGQLSPDDVPIVINRGSSGSQNASRGMTVRWLAQATEIGYLRAKSDEYTSFGPEVFYDISFRDTTYFAPRWNSSGTQVSVVVIQNVTTNPVSGELHFYNVAGSLLATTPFILGPNALHILSTASLSALVGQSGSASIAHLGGYGALSGKVVSLEPATGFTFDTAFTPVPR